MKRKFTKLFTVCMAIGSLAVNAQEAQKGSEQPTKKHWYESIQLRGYVQARYNRLLETNDALKVEQADKSIGNNNAFFLRRVRLIFSGQISERVYFYIQPDFASSTGSADGTSNLGQLRDCYFDLGLDAKNEYRLRVGQSKVPYGFENLQSSQNRLPLDRNDALNSALSNERDLGVFFYYAPDAKRKLFSKLVSDGLKGSGDYGVFALGVYNGQLANQKEANNNLHVVARVSYPFEIGDQIIEPGIQAYTGQYVLASVSSTMKSPYVNSDKSYWDGRAAASFVLYPKPFGIQAEYTIGKGPQYNYATKSILLDDLKGGYVTLSYKKEIAHQTFIPFYRYTFYEGGKKHELDARYYKVYENEFGIEWQPVKQFELTAMYTITSRKQIDSSTKAANYLQEGNLLRLQAQINF